MLQPYQESRGLFMCPQCLFTQLQPINSNARSKVPCFRQEWSRKYGMQYLKTLFAIGTFYAPLIENGDQVRGNFLTKFSEQISADEVCQHPLN